MSSLESDCPLVGILPAGELCAVIVRVRVARDTSNVEEEVPAILTNRGFVLPLLDYCCKMRSSRSPDWLYKLCRACVHFLEYAAANRELTDTELFSTFAQRLVTGTFGGGARVDHSWLCWKPVSLEHARRTVSLLTSFFSDVDTLKSLRSVPTPYDLFMRRAAHAHAREKAFLGHTWEVSPSTESVTGSASPLPTPLSPSSGDSIAFPEDRLMDLLFKGWCSRGKLSHRDVALTLLLNCGGLRTSEPFHLYVTDVGESSVTPGVAVVLIHHPSTGAAPERWSDNLGNPTARKRSSYLSDVCDMSPRQLLLGTKHSGFKGAAMKKAHDSLYFEVQWFPQQLGALFMRVWNRYLIDVVSIPRSHPFAFINMSRGVKGDLYTLSAFRQAHAAAVKRIGLVQSRLEGTAPHGHRHAYGRRLARAGLDGENIMNLMHHRSLESHRVYTKPGQVDLMQDLAAANERMAATPEGRMWDQFVGEATYRLDRA